MLTLTSLTWLAHRDNVFAAQCLAMGHWDRARSFASAASQWAAWATEIEMSRQ